MVDHAWMLSQKGTAYPVPVHIYVDYDENLASESGAAQFMINSDMDEGLPRIVYDTIDAWMGMLIEYKVDFDTDSTGIDDCIKEALKSLPYHFPHGLSESQLIQLHRDCDNYHDTGELYDFLDEYRTKLKANQDEIATLLNQNFCRVRLGGQYDSEEGNTTLWFRIGSHGFNWVNTIYIWVADNYRSLHVEYISICRDYESDNGLVNGKPEYFYKAKDGVPYFEMPIQEYLAEDHEHNPSFASTYITLDSIMATEVSDALKPNTRKVKQVEALICNQYPEIWGIDFDIQPRENREGKLVGFELILTLHSKYKEIDGLNVSLTFSRSLDQISPAIIARSFRIEWEDYKKYKNIKV